MTVGGASEHMERSGTTASGRGDIGGADKTSSTAELSPSVRSLLTQFPEDVTPTAGELAAKILRTHARRRADPYLDEAAANMAASSKLRELGNPRTARAHLGEVRGLWDADVRMLTGRHVVLGLALLGLGPELLDTGVVASMLTTWRPGHPPDEPERVAWDAMSDAGRRAAEAQPLLAVALGAPAEAELTVPGPVRAMAWSPRGDRLALLVDGDVLTATPREKEVRRLGSPPSGAVSVGWGSAGVAVLSLEDRMAVVSLVPDGLELGRFDAVGGILSGDGYSAWLQSSSGVVRWSAMTSAIQPVSGSGQQSATPLAVDHTGSRGLLAIGSRAALVSAAAGPGRLPGAASWPSDAAPLMGWGPATARAWALPAPGRLRCVAMTKHGLELRDIAGDVEDIEDKEGLLVCRIATGRVDVTTLALDATGTLLAVAADGHVRIWSLRYGPAQTLLQPAFDNDRPDRAEDYLETRRDARAITALISSRDLDPPLSIGLFGDWGSGKSFLLQQILDELDEERPPGFLKHLRVVEFNAWQYAETNLWASLVDAVLRRIGPLQDPPSGAEVGEAETRVEEAEALEEDVAAQVTTARRQVSEAQVGLLARRRRTRYAVAALLLVVAAAIAAVALGSSSGVAALWASAASLLTVAAAALREAVQARKSANEAAQTVASGARAADRLLGRPEQRLLAERVTDLQELEKRHGQTEALIAERKKHAQTARDFAEREPLQALLQGMANVQEYRDQLSMVTRVHELFKDIDAAVRASRNRREGTEAAPVADAAQDNDSAQEPRAAPGTQDRAPKEDLDRVIVVIDDLDRCPAEKVVGVLEAVHLLFGFEMFVVIIAVDTRWLEQSLRIRYRQLLGRPDTASPTDYLEKILQVPIQLPAMDVGRARRLISGLTSRTGEVPPDDGPAAASDPAANRVPFELNEDGAWLTATQLRILPPSLPADVLRVTPRETAAMVAVADLFATTPRTVKRFVNTYRLIKAGSDSPDLLDADVDEQLGDHEIVAFLLALLIGKPAAAAAALGAIRSAAPTSTVGQALRAADPPETTQARGPAPSTEIVRHREQLDSLLQWLDGNPPYANQPASRMSAWIPDVARYSFVRDTQPSPARRPSPAATHTG